ncbi:SIMPL domain-containing protein [Stutzerimonas zhaodongensis]|uniref:SIMPL domain-containing protein n=1 Tax=Stutzerimonas zhaodongensis TaxID=1176257 RepID=A0A3M2HS38_9GAMM|nr:SIMPL domain-containing protein [Stutzerimonas zhaodongensis]MCQ2029353.1 SIMPL domain-containing protein [Stutzerimonas zhaodongensis]MCQ4316831.1 SIMPL domain-containing protein [Stutzerimonas zhaodongensis]RMH92576.1 SIMPL domain-containing protein [Stutzerimonas zhaodongensis]
MTTARIGLLPALLIATSLAFAGWSVGQGVERFRMADRSVTVKGLAERDVQSDFAVWALGFRRAGNDFAGVQKGLSEDRNRVVAFLREQGFSDDEIQVQPLQVQDLLAREWAPQAIALRFNGNGQVLVKTARIEAVGKAANGVDPLIQAGIQLDTEQNGFAGPRYQLRGFNDLKPALLQDATRNAYEQAAKFAEDAGARLGELKTANQGVIRVLDDDGSDMDTGRTPGKRLRVVSTFEYSLR